MQETEKSAVRQKLALRTRNFGKERPSIDKRADESAVAASSPERDTSLIPFSHPFQAQTAEFMHPGDLARPLHGTNPLANAVV
jgi:hypothetical protein